MRMRKGVIAALIALSAAVILTIVLIVSGQPAVKTPDGGIRLDNKLDTTAVERYVVDEADILADKTEHMIAVYNANWTELSGRVMAVVTVEEGASEEFAWAWTDIMGLGGNDALLLLEKNGTQKRILVSRGTFLDDLSSQPDGFVDS